MHVSLLLKMHERQSLIRSSRRDSLQPICLDQVPNYATAISSPEVFGNDVDPSPTYSVSAIAAS